MTNYTDDKKNAIWAEIEKIKPIPELYQEGDITVDEIQAHYDNCDKETARNIMHELEAHGDWKYLMVRRPGGGQKVAVIRKVSTTKLE